MRSAWQIAPVAMFTLFALTSSTSGDGIIHRLPADGSWVQFDLAYQSLKPGGGVAVSGKGTLTMKSVGREQPDGVECRWIEMETATETQLDRPKAVPVKNVQVIKMLIPEKHLMTGQNPLSHVLKARTRDSNGAPKDLDLKGPEAMIIESLDELFHEPLSMLETFEEKEIATPGGKFMGTRRNGRGSTPTGDRELESETWLSDKVPFGVAAYRFNKTRLRDGQPNGNRWIEIKYLKSGTDAKSGVTP